MSPPVHDAVPSDEARDAAERRRARLQQAFETHHASLVRLAQTVGSRELADAEDAVQTTFLVLATKRAELLDDEPDPAEAERRLRTYLYGSVPRRMLNTARSAGSRHRRGARFVRETDASPWPAPDAAVEAQQLRERYQAVKPLLSSQQRKVIEGVYEEGLTYVEIGVRLGITTGAAKRHGARALQKLRDLLEPHA